MTGEDECALQLEDGLKLINGGFHFDLCMPAWTQKTQQLGHSFYVATGLNFLHCSRSHKVGILLSSDQNSKRRRNASTNHPESIFQLFGVYCKLSGVVLGAFMKGFCAWWKQIDRQNSPSLGLSSMTYLQILPISFLSCLSRKTRIRVTRFTIGSPLAFPASPACRPVSI